MFEKIYFIFYCLSRNAVALATTPLSYEKLMESKLADIAILVRKNIAQVNEEYIFNGLNTLNGLNKQEGVEVNEKLQKLQKYLWMFLNKV